MVASLDIWSVLILVSLAHSLFAINLFLIKKEYQKPEGRWLLLLLVALIWYQAEFLSIRWPHDVGFDWFYGTRFGSWMLLGPLLHFYIKSIIGQAIRRSDLLQLLPFLTITLLMPLVLDEFLSFRQVHYGMLTPFDKRPDQINVLQYFYSGIFIFQFMHFGYFLWLTRGLIHAYDDALKENVSNLPVGQSQWLKVFWKGMVFILCLITFFIGLLFFTEIYRRWSDYLYVLPMSVLVYLISYKLAGVSWVKPEVLEKNKYEKSALPKLDTENYKKRIEVAFNENRLHLNQELRLKDLAVELDLSTHQLSQLLNQHLRTNFFDLVNRYRVEEAKFRMKQNPEYTLIHIAFESGFNNKTSFVNAFKKYEGKTPSEFLKKSA